MISDRKIHDPVLGVDHAGVLADPAEPGVLRVDALLDRTGVDVGPAPRAPSPASARSHVEHALEPRLDHDVVVVAPRVARDRRLRAVGGLGRVRAVGVVDRAEDDHRARRRQDRADVHRGARRSAAGSPSRRHARRRAIRAGSRAPGARRPARCRRGRTRAPRLPLDLRRASPDGARDRHGIHPAQRVGVRTSTQLAQHVRQDAAVPERDELLGRVDARDRRDLAARAVRRRRRGRDLAAPAAARRPCRATS